MTDIIPFDEEYTSWIKDIKTRYQQARIKAAVSSQPGADRFCGRWEGILLRKEADKNMAAGLIGQAQQGFKILFLMWRDWLTQSSLYG